MVRRIWKKITVLLMMLSLVCVSVPVYAEESIPNTGNASAFDEEKENDSTEEKDESGENGKGPENEGSEDPEKDTAGSGGAIRILQKKITRIPQKRATRISQKRAIRIL